MENNTPETKGQTPEEKGQIPETKGQTPEEKGQTPEEKGNIPEEKGQIPENKNLPDFAKTLQEKAKGQEKSEPNKENEPKTDEFSQWLEKLPAEMTDEQSASFWQKMGRPDTADGYELPKDDNLNFKQIAFENNLSKAQAKSVYERISNAGLEFLKRQQEADEKQIAETEKFLRDTYADKYDEKITLMQKGIEAFGGVSLLNKLKSSGLLFDKDIVQQYIAIGEMTAESGSFSRGANGGKDGYVSPLDGGLLKF